jgi:hypothetical protein
VAALFGLLAVWIGVELLYASHWLSPTDNHRPRPRPTSPSDTLRQQLSRAPGQPVARVWFAPYTTFPETGLVESVWRKGVYDTFLAFPGNGLKANYGAFKLSLADSLFAQASSQGLRQEAELAQRLGYRLLAIDLGAITTPQPLQALCERSHGCSLSSDGYALFPLNGASGSWIPQLSAFQRRIPQLPQISAAPRWGGLVFHPDHWWQPRLLPGLPAPGALVWAQPRWSVQLYRHDLSRLPPGVRQALIPAGSQVWLRLAPGLKGVTLCLKREGSGWRSGASPCHRIKLRHNAPRLEITHLLPPGKVTTLQLEWIYGPEGLPYPLRLLPGLAGDPQKRSALGVEVGTKGDNGGHGIQNPGAPEKILRAW